MFYHCHTFYVLFRFFYYLYCSMQPRIYFLTNLTIKEIKHQNNKLESNFYGRKRIMEKNSFADKTWQEEVSKTWNSTKLNIFWKLNISLQFSYKCAFCFQAHKNSSNGSDKIKWSFFKFDYSFRRKIKFIDCVFSHQDAAWN